MLNLSSHLDLKMMVDMAAFVIGPHFTQFKLILATTGLVVKQFLLDVVRIAALSSDSTIVKILEESQNIKVVSRVFWEMMKYLKSFAKGAHTNTLMMISTLTTRDRIRGGKSKDIFMS